MPTIKEIAKECKVSIATVSNILNNKGRVGEDTRRLVLETAEKLNYVPNAAAKTLKQRSTKTIGVITEDLTVFNTPEIVDGIDQYLEEKGYAFILGNLRLYKKHGNKFYHLESYWDQIEDEVNVMKAKQAEGLVYVCAHSRDIRNMITDTGLPTVLVYGFTTKSLVPSVIFHDERAACGITKRLLASGDQKIGVIAGEAESIHTRERLMGYQTALYEAGILFNPSFVVYSDWTREGGYRAARELMERGIRTFFSMNDKMAAGLYQYAGEKGLRLGEDIHAAGIGSEISELLNPPLTTMKLPLFEMGRKAASLMVDMLDRKKAKDIREPECVYKIDCSLLEGGSI